MKATTLHDIPGWKLISFGNGLSYTFINSEAKREIFVQGDDANVFFDELITLTEGRLQLDYAEAFKRLWNTYSDLSEPCSGS